MKIWFLLFSILLVPGIFAGGSLRGQEKSTTTCTINWSGSIPINGVFTVEIGEVLCIAPKTIVTFETPESRIDVLGTILAIGTQTEFIVWTGTTGWNGIKLRNAQQAVFEYCSFNNINPIGTLLEGGIFVSMTDNTTFNNCVYYSNKGGIVIVNSSNLSIKDCFFSGNIINGTERGIIFLENSTSAVIKNNVFNNNTSNGQGIISLNLSSSAQIINNYFQNTKYSNPNNPPINKGYPVIILNGSNYLNHAVINSNHFSRNFDREIVLWGTSINDPTNTIAFIWNNDFDGKKVLPTTRKKTAIFARYSIFTISHCTIHDYDAGGIRFDYCDAKIHLNTFYSNLTTDGVIKIDKYQGYSGSEINNEIFYNTFENNSGIKGAAIWSELGISNCYNSIENNVFNNNTSTQEGGGIFAIDSRNLFVKQNNFYNNTSSGSDGGAICLENPVNNIEIIENDFSENTSGQSGGGLMIDFSINALSSSLIIKDNILNENQATDGGGLAAISTTAPINEKVLISHNEFNNNNASENGGAMYLHSIKAEVTDTNRIDGNGAVNGAGIWASDMSALTITDNKVLFNKASQNGGGIFIQNSGKIATASEMENTVFLIQDNDIYRNGYQMKGGGLYLENCNNIELIRNFVRDNFFEYTLNPIGAGIYVKNSNLTFYNNNILSNWGALGGGLYFDIDNTNSLVFNNNNVVNHFSEAGIVFPNGNLNINDILINNCLFYGNDLYSIKYPKANSSSPKLKVYNCYFDHFNGQSPDTWVDPINCQFALWPGWTLLNKFYLDCETSICVDNGVSTPIFYDPAAPSPPNTAIPPSCKTLLNDIGISGGPYALDNGFLFDATMPPGLSADFDYEIVDRENKIIRVFDKSKVEIEGATMQWNYGDGNHSERMNYTLATDFTHEYHKNLEKTLITLILRADDAYSYHSEIIDFGNKKESEIIDNSNQAGLPEKNVTGKPFTLYPNPSDGWLSVMINRPVDLPVQLKISDVFGRIVFNETINSSNQNTDLDLSNELPGVYYLIVDVDGKQFIEKLILH